MAESLVAELHMQIVWRNVEDLIPYARNSRTHSDGQIAQLAASIQEWGWTNPVIINGANNQIIAGHGRLLAARKLGMLQVPCVDRQDLTPAQMQAYVIADNKLAENSGWDKEMLAVEIGELQQENFDIDLLGFDGAELADLLADPLAETPAPEGESDIPATQEQAVTKPGDIWLLGPHRLMCGNSTSLDDVQKLLLRNKPDLVYTDPPYGIDLLKKKQNLGNSQEYHRFEGDDSTDTAGDAYRLCAGLNIPVLLFWGANHYADQLPPSSGWVVWDKQGGKQVDFADCELAWTNQAVPARIFQHIWDGFRRDSEQGETRVHPTQKPVALAVSCFEKFARDAKVVLDIFGGSGSTLMACEQTKKKACVMEIDPYYCDVIIRRWQQQSEQKAILASDGRSFDEVAAAS